MNYAVAFTRLKVLTWHDDGFLVHLNLFDDFRRPNYLHTPVCRVLKGIQLYLPVELFPKLKILENLFFLINPNNRVSIDFVYHQLYCSVWE